MTCTSARLWQAYLLRIPVTSMIPIVTQHDCFDAVRNEDGGNEDEIKRRLSHI